MLNNKIYKTIRNNRFFTCLFLLLLLLNACKKADEQYQKLHDQPEVLKNSYDKVYGVGDTLTMEGRLNPQNNLVIHIGNANAKILYTRKTVVSVPSTIANSIDTIDLVKVLISADMGIGSNRLITITSAGNTINAPAIEIVGDLQSGLLPNALKLTEHYSMQAGTKPLYCQNGTGNIYLWKPGKTITLLKADGTTTEIFNKSDCKDTFGPFEITTFNSGGVDPKEQYLYFSAITTDGNADNDANEIYRLCRWDTKNKQLLTLNRTLYAKDSKQHTLTAAQPFEGTIANAKIFQITGIYPDSKGNVYFNLAGHFLTKLDVGNHYSYTFSFTNYSYPPFIPEIINPKFNQPYALSEIHGLLPGVNIEAAKFLGIDPDNGLMYGKNGTSFGLIQYDLVNQAQLFIMPATWFLNTNTSSKIYLSGSFGVLTGPNFNSNGSDFGYMPLPNQKLLILMYQELENTPDGRFSDRTPAWEALDFKQKRGDRYAPGKLIRGSFQMTDDDVLLNYDKDGMLYTTANSNTVIVKTIAQ